MRSELLLRISGRSAAQANGFDPVTGFAPEAVNAVHIQTATLLTTSCRKYR